MFIKNFHNRILRAPEGDGGASGGAGAGTGGEKPWFDSFDADTKGYLQNRGWDKKTPAEAFQEASKAHREAEKFVGAPANEILRLPKDPNAPEWAGVWSRLGKPAEAKEYDLSSVKRAGDKPVEGALADDIRNAAFNANLSKDAAIRFAQDIVKHLDNSDANSAAAKADKLAQEKSDLKKNWGANEAANMVVARQTAAALGIDPAAVNALEGVVGYAKIMEMFRGIGVKIGEDRFVTGGGAHQNGVMTREQAVAEKNSLKADKAWVKRYIDGGIEERKRMEGLDRIITGVTA